MAVNIMGWKWITINFHNFHRILLTTILCAQYCTAHIDGWTQTACDDTQPALVTSSGTIITSPVYPNGTYLLSQDCTWLARAAPGQVIRLTFTIFDLEDVYPCWFAFVHVYDGPAIDDEEYLRNFCGRTLPGVTHTSTHEMLIHYQSLEKGEGRGFEATVDFIDINSIACGNGPVVLSWKQGGFVSPEWPNNYPPGFTCSWRIETSLDLRLEFIDWNLRPPGEAGCTDVVSVYDGPTTSDPHIATYCGPDLPDVTSMTSHALLVVFDAYPYYYDYDGKFRVEFSTSNVTEVGCGEDRNIDIDWSPGFINGPITNDSHCRWRFYAPEGKVIRFEIEYFDLPPCANCGCSKVTLYNGENFDDSAMIGSYCEGGWLDEYLQSGGNKAGMTYDSYRLNPGTGFSIKYTFYDFSDHACSNDRPINLTHDHGIITSPLYDKGYYPMNTDCQWSIHTTLGKVVEFHFLTFAVQSCISCICDVLYIYNGPTLNTDLEVRRLCDSYKPNLFLTSLPGAYLVFVSDDTSTNNPGFKIEYEIITLADKACGDQQPVEVTLSPGDIVSPNYGTGHYPQQITCQWLISTVFEKAIKLEFVTFDIEFDEPHRCMFDWLEVYDGDSTESSPLMGKFCGSELPETIVGTSRLMLIKFVANHYIEGDGFHLKFEETDPLPAASMAAVIIPAVVCGALAAAALIAVMVVYGQKYHKKRRARSNLPPLRTPLNLESVLRSRPPRPRSSGIQNPEVSDISNVDHLYDQTYQAVMFPWSDDHAGESDNFNAMLSPPSYREASDHQPSRRPATSMDCPPPTYEESLGHRLARDGQSAIVETSFVENTVSIHHGMVDTDTDSDSTITTFNHNTTRTLDISRYSGAVNNAFGEEDECGPIDLNVSRLSRNLRAMRSRSRSQADPGLDRTRDSWKSRSRAPTYDNPLNTTRTSIQPAEPSGSVQNGDPHIKREQKMHERQLKSTALDQNGGVLRRKLANKTASEKLRLSRSYDDILGSKAFNISMTNLDLVNKDDNGDAAGTSGQYNEPGEGTLRRRARSETHLLSRMASRDGQGTSFPGLSIRRQSESEARETTI